MHSVQIVAHILVAHKVAYMVSYGITQCAQHIEPNIGSTQCAHSSTYVRTQCGPGQPAQPLCERQRPALYKHMTWYELT